jgi:hypothetical protein
MNKEIEEIVQEFYIVDYHKNMLESAEVIVNSLKDKGYHTMIYLTDLEDNLMVNRVSEDEFLSHFSNKLEE